MVEGRLGASCGLADRRGGARAIGDAGDAGVEALAMASWALGEIRRTKSEAKKPLRTPVLGSPSGGASGRSGAFEAARCADVAASGFVQRIRTVEGDERAAIVELGELEPAPEVRA